MRGRMIRRPAEAGRARAIHSPEPLNRAFGPEGFLRRFDLRSELGRITAPTLVLAGRHDWICPPEFSEEIARLIPRCGPPGVRAQQPLDPRR